VTHGTRLSCHRFQANEARLQLSVLAYNLGNLWRRLVLPMRIDAWSLTSLQQRLVKTSEPLIQHARYYWLQPAESHLTLRLFGSMLHRIAALPSPAGWMHRRRKQISLTIETGEWEKVFEK
jgi:Transposase DDE domain group 1